MKLPEPHRIVQGFGMEAEYLYTQEQMREALASRDAVLRMAWNALEDGDLFDIADAIRGIKEVLG